MKTGNTETVWGKKKDSKEREFQGLPWPSSG